MILSCETKWEITEDENCFLIAQNDKKVLFYQKAPRSYQGKSERCNYIHPLYGLNEQGNKKAFASEDNYFKVYPAEDDFRV